MFIIPLRIHFFNGKYLQSLSIKSSVFENNPKKKR